MRRKGQKTIANVFLRYICLLAGGALMWLLVLVGIFVALEALGEVLPANYAELWLNETAAEIRTASEVTENMIPPECTFGVYKTDGSWRYGTFSGELRELAWEHYEKNDAYTDGSGYLRFLERDKGEVCIVNYRITMLYRNAFLRKWVPRMDFLLVIGYVVLFLLHTFVVSRHFGKDMGARLAVLNEVTGEIRNQNLDFERTHSELKEVEEVLDSLYQMKEALKSSLHRQWNLEKGKEEQIAALAHDIRTPLTVIRGNAELLAEGELAEEEQEYNRDILQSVAIMEEYLEMLHEILQADRTEMENGSAQEDDEERQITCEALAGKMEEQARLLASARQCGVTFRRGPLRGMVRGSESRMIRAFQNIVSNALDYSPPGKGIRIAFSNREEAGKAYLLAVVTDEGPGFSAEDLKYAAERFYQGDKSRSSKVHYGIGLHTARQFAMGQGGYLVMENGEEGGAKVTLGMLLLTSGPCTALHGHRPVQY